MPAQRSCSLCLVIGDAEVSAVFSKDQRFTNVVNANRSLETIRSRGFSSLYLVSKFDNNDVMLITTNDATLSAVKSAIAGHISRFSRASINVIFAFPRQPFSVASREISKFLVTGVNSLAEVFDPKTLIAATRDRETEIEHVYQANNTIPNDVTPTSFGCRFFITLGSHHNSIQDLIEYFQKHNAYMVTDLSQLLTLIACNDWSFHQSLRVSSSFVPLFLNRELFSEILGGKETTEAEYLQDERIILEKPELVKPLSIQDILRALK